MGILASLIANINRDPKQQKQPYTPKDFIPQFDRKTPTSQTQEEQLMILEMLNAAFGGNDLRAKP